MGRLYQFSPHTYTVSKYTISLNFDAISYILTDTNSKVNGMFENHYIMYMGVMGNIDTISSLCGTRTHILNDIFDIGTEVHIFGTWGLEQLWSDSDHFNTWLGIFKALFVQSFIQIFSLAFDLHTVNVSKSVRWNLKGFYTKRRCGYGPISHTV